LAISPLIAQDYVASSEYWSIEDGLSDRNVYTAFKGKDGILWLGTRNGLNSFNGYEFKYWTTDNKEVNLQNITRIGQDDEGWLWLQRQDNLVFFHPKTHEFKTIIERFGEDCVLNNFSASHYADNFENDSFGRILYEDFLSNVLYTYHSTEGFKKIAGLEKPQSLTNSTTDTFFVKHNNYSLKKLFWNKNDNSFQTIAYYNITKKGKLLRINKTLYYKNIEDKIKNIGDLSKKNFKNGFFWVIEDTKLNIYDKNNALLSSINLENKFSTRRSQFNKITIEDKNTIWITSQFGLYRVKIRKNYFNFYPSPKFDKFGQLSVRGISIINNELMAGLEGAHYGKYNFDTKTWKVNSKNTLHNNLDKVILPINKNEYWQGGLNTLQHTKHGIQKDYNLYDNSSDHNISIWSMEASSSKTNQFWLGTSKGIYLFNPEESSIYPIKKIREIVQNDFVTIVSIIPNETLKNNYWLCSNKGLFLFDENEGTFTRFHTGADKNYLPANNFYHLYQDKDEVIWLATGGQGIIRWDRKNNTHRQFTIKDGLANNSIYAIYEDDFDNLWMSSDFGIIRMNKHSFTVQNFSPQSGIGQQEFNRISHHQTADGRLFFGGLRGVTSLNPKHFNQQNKIAPPQIALNSYKEYNGKQNTIEDKTLELTNSLELILRPSDYIFDLEFSVLSYENVDKNQYIYQLTKNGKIYTDWTSQNKRSIQLGNLPYGNYELTVKGKDIFGTSTSNEIKLTIIAKRPFYLTWWFSGLVAILLFSIGYCYTSWRTYIFKQRQEHLEQEIQKATQQIRADKKTIEAQAEDLRKLDELKTRFFANVSHELRTPLTLMLGPIKSVLKRQNIDNKSHTFLSTAEQNGHKLLKLVNEILDLNKLEAGKLALKEETVHFYSFVKRLTSNFMSYAESTNVSFLFDYQLERDIHLLLDKHKLETILNNLLSNAFKFTTKDGKIQVEILEKINNIQIIVKDTGRGIHPEDLPNVFDRFYQSKQKGAAEGGTGIGLALCKEFSELLGGKIWVESQYGEGAQFYVEIPKTEVLKTTSNSDYEMSQEPLLVASTPVKKVIDDVKNENKNTLLIVEDNASLQNYLKLILEEEYQIVTANNGAEALEVLEKTSVNLIVSDIMMPIMDGYALLKELKENNQYRSIPVIMLTAKADKADKLNALRIGVDDYLLKPFDEDELLARISNLIENNVSRQTEWQKISLEETSEETESEAIIFTKENSEWLAKLEKTVFEQVGLPHFTTETLAQEMAISRRQLNRKIKEYTGLTPNKYIVEIRLQKARSLFEKSPGLTVKEVSYEVGFSKTEYFSKLFKARFGKNPSELIGI
jgi:signal transduction histidine kinase/DNA-binding response OmpR family regulator/ligand-binding sensor domain-containing protein